MPQELPGVAAARGMLPGILVAGLRGVAGGALRRGDSRPEELGGGGLAPLCDAPGTYLYDR